MPPLYLIALILSATFAISLAALLSAQLVRSLCRRRSPSPEVVTVESVLNTPSTELHPNYFLFWKKQLVRVQPAPTSLQEEKEEEEEEEEEEDVVAKWQAMHGGSRFLYTIKEEDREGENSVEIESSIKDGKITERPCLADVLTLSVVNEVDLMSDDDDLSEELATPTTMSPMYHTPPPPKQQLIKMA